MNVYVIFELRPPIGPKIGPWPLGYVTQRILHGPFTSLTQAWRMCAVHREAARYRRLPHLYVVVDEESIKAGVDG